jgi:hypothetical protein
LASCLQYDMGWDALTFHLGCVNCTFNQGFFLVSSVGFGFPHPIFWVETHYSSFYMV